MTALQKKVSTISTEVFQHDSGLPVTDSRNKRQFYSSTEKSARELKSFLSADKTQTNFSENLV